MIKTWQELVKAVYKKCVDNAEVVYNRPSGRCTLLQLNDSNLCYYTKGQCTDGSIGCIFGQVLKDYDLSRYEGKNGSCLPISFVLRDILVDIPDCVMQWCRTIQLKQDQKTSWGDALIEAEFLYGPQVDELLA